MKIHKFNYPRLIRPSSIIDFITELEPWIWLDTSVSGKIEFNVGSQIQRWFDRRDRFTSNWAGVIGSDYANLSIGTANNGGDEVDLTDGLFNFPISWPIANQAWFGTMRDIQTSLVVPGIGAAYLNHGDLVATAFGFDYHVLKPPNNAIVTGLFDGIYSCTSENVTVGVPSTIRFRRNSVLEFQGTQTWAYTSDPSLPTFGPGPNAGGSKTSELIVFNRDLETRFERQVIENYMREKWNL